MNLTVLLRDFLIQKRAKKAFENYILNDQPQLANTKGRFDWTNGKYEKYLRTVVRPDRFSPEHMLGMEVGAHTFSWAMTKEGKEFWWKLCSEFGQLARRKSYENNHIV